ncbi:hypothetical protein GCM10009551_093640 [Nocardiopsis tropica]
MATPTATGMPGAEVFRKPDRAAARLYTPGLFAAVISAAPPPIERPMIDRLLEKPRDLMYDGRLVARNVPQVGR